MLLLRISPGRPRGGRSACSRFCTLWTWAWSPARIAAVAEPIGAPYFRIFSPAAMSAAPACGRAAGRPGSRPRCLPRRSPRRLGSGRRTTKTLSRSSRRRSRGSLGMGPLGSVRRRGRREEARHDEAAGRPGADCSASTLLISATTHGGTPNCAATVAAVSPAAATTATPESQSSSGSSRGGAYSIGIDAPPATSGPAATSTTLSTILSWRPGHPRHVEVPDTGIVLEVDAGEISLEILGG